MGETVLKADIEKLDGITGLQMPLELREFYLEMGDGFQFIPDTNPKSGLVGWEPMSLADHELNNRGFRNHVEEEAMSGLHNHSPRADPQNLRKEMERRKNWMPFYGFVGGGACLCLDLSTSPPAVMFHESAYWWAVPQTWSFILAASLIEFVERWGHYHFLSPAGAWTSFCSELSGQFDWAPKHFPHLGAQRG
jgi:hypothetical protein